MRKKWKSIDFTNVNSMVEAWTVSLSEELQATKIKVAESGRRFTECVERLRNAKRNIDLYRAQYKKSQEALKELQTQVCLCKTK